MEVLLRPSDQALTKRSTFFGQIIMSTILAASSRQACRHKRVILLGRSLLSSSAAATAHQEQEGGPQSRLDALRERLKLEETSAAALKLQDFSFSGDVSYGTAVPRRTRDSKGKVRPSSSILRFSFWHSSTKYRRRSGTL